jgi:hypothetical protein
VAHSFAFAHGLTFEQVLAGHLIEDCLANDEFWCSQPGILCQRYERLVADLPGSVIEIARHLGIDLCPDDAREIASNYSQAANRVRADEVASRLGRSAAAIDPHSLLHWNHIRGGRSGEWRELTPPRLLLSLAQRCGAWLVSRGYEKDMAWLAPVQDYLLWLEASLQQSEERFAPLAHLGASALSCAERLQSLADRFPRLRLVLRKFLRGRILTSRFRQTSPTTPEFTKGKNGQGNHHA